MPRIGETGKTGTEGLRPPLPNEKTSRGQSPCSRNLLCYGDICDLVGTLEREKAELGVFLTLDDPSALMKSEAASAGMYTSPFTNKPYPRIQIITIADLLADPHRPNPRRLLIPAGLPANTLPEVEKHKGKGEEQKGLGFLSGEGGPITGIETYEVKP